MTWFPVFNNETAAIGPPAREWYRKSPGDISEFGIWIAAAALYSAPGIWNRSGSIDALFTGIDARVAVAWSLVPAGYQCQFSATRGESPVHLDVQPAWQSLSQALSVSVLVGDSAFEIQHVYSQFQLYQLPRTLRIRPPCQLQRRHNCGSGLFSSATNGSSFDCFCSFSWHSCLSSF